MTDNSCKKLSDQKYLTIIEFSFRIILRIMEIGEGVIRPRRITPSKFNNIIVLLFNSKINNS